MIDVFKQDHEVDNRVAALKNIKDQNFLTGLMNTNMDSKIRKIVLSQLYEKNLVNFLEPYLAKEEDLVPIIKDLIEADIQNDTVDGIITQYVDKYINILKSGKDLNEKLEAGKKLNFIYHNNLNSKIKQKLLQVSGTILQQRYTNHELSYYEGRCSKTCHLGYNDGDSYHVDNPGRHVDKHIDKPEIRFNLHR